jgi:cyclic pyranopterin phosphate synthase
MRFIEYMPLDAEHNWEREKVVFADEILDVLAREVAPLAPAPDQDPRAPAVDYDYLDGKGRVGMIASVSRPFCMSCNRLRLTSDGKLRNCLFALDETDVRGLLRSHAPDAAIAKAIVESVSAKWEGHEINTARFIQPGRAMHSIGG